MHRLHVNQFSNYLESDFQCADGHFLEIIIDLLPLAASHQWPSTSVSMIRPTTDDVIIRYHCVASWINHNLGSENHSPEPSSTKCSFNGDWGWWLLCGSKIAQGGLSEIQCLIIIRKLISIERRSSASTTNLNPSHPDNVANANLRDCREW